MNHALSISLVIACLLPQLAALAQAPDSLSVQGLVADTAGVPINDPGASITFKLYENGTEVWSETQPSVEIVDGIFNVLLGSVTPLDTVAFNRPLELGVKIGADPEISPQTPLAAAAYAKALPGMYTFFSEPEPNRRGFNVVGGGPGNSVAPNVAGATISGGGGLRFGLKEPNQVLGDFGTIGGGLGNIAGVIATVSGGLSNEAADVATVGGGRENIAGDLGTVGGGQQNEAGAVATVGGGRQNTASGDESVVGGGGFNIASGRWSTVPGGFGNEATGSWSFAVGRRAKAHHNGTFVWADSMSTGHQAFTSTGTDQFLIRAGGGVGIGTNAPTTQLSVSGTADFDSVGIGTNAPTNELSVNGTADFDDVGIGTNAPTNELSVNGTADFDNVGINASPGSHRLAVAGSGTGISGAVLDADNSSTGSGIAAHFETSGTDATVVIDQDGTGDHIRTFDNGNLRFRVHDNGDVTADGSFTGSGADVAEAFAFEGSAESYDPGDVLVVSTRENRSVTLSRRPYSTFVAGVYATKPGVVLTDRGIEEDFSERIPLGVVGVVPTKVTLENGPIRRGDLLVTSSTPGHAMRSEPVIVEGVELYPTGAILGKALEPFDGPDSGMIEVLVGVR